MSSRARPASTRRPSATSSPRSPRRRALPHARLRPRHQCDPRLRSQCFASLAYEATSKEKLAAPGSAAAPRLFALNKFVETTLHNLHRIRSLWPLVTQFLLPVANHKTARIRVIGMESLSKVPQQPPSRRSVSQLTS